MKRIVLIFVALALLVPLASCSRDLSVEDIDKSITIEEAVVYEWSNFRIVAETLEYYEECALLSFACYDSSVNCVKRHRDAASPLVQDVSINGYMVNASLDDIQDDIEILFEYEDLIASGITQIANIEIPFRIKGGGVVIVEVQTSACDSYNYSKNMYQKHMKSGAIGQKVDSTVEHFSTDEIYKSGAVHLLSTAITRTEDNMFLWLEFENLTSNTKLNINAKELHINGALINNGTIFSRNVMAQKRVVISVSLGSFLQQYEGNLVSVDPIETIEFLFNANDGNYNAFYESKTNYEKISIEVNSIKIPENLN